MKKLFKLYHLWLELRKIDYFKFRPEGSPPIDANAICIAKTIVRWVANAYHVVGTAIPGDVGINIEWSIENQIVRCTIQNKDVRHKRVPKNGEWWPDE